MPTTERAAPGWYGDPYGRHEYREWDGAAWTSRVRDGDVEAEDHRRKVGTRALSGGQLVRARLFFGLALAGLIAWTVLTALSNDPAQLFKLLILVPGVIVVATRWRRGVATRFSQVIGRGPQPGPEDGDPRNS